MRSWVVYKALLQFRLYDSVLRQCGWSGNSFQRSALKLFGAFLDAMTAMSCLANGVAMSA
jgi:hypothetical protein